MDLGSLRELLLRKANFDASPSHPFAELDGDRPICRAARHEAEVDRLAR
jgi:hypothetical protein